ncbi:helix-turn-helix domain-containing protein [Bacillus sp. OK048]|uniref:response regulator transcription factor n=1 Tax=Bacillus sp. OK048 TaxID=1882761 RepID=UPI00088AD8EB|nr:helix-turn-helix domain-containing protein [Bacillus sp. OK048]SDN23382.1 two-component system, response regulator YesN [Bacillus sp. OK048]
MYKVMLVDDDVPMLKYLENIMDWGDLGVEIVASTFSSVKALTLFDEYQPDLVITDIGIPQIDGLELAVRFKEMNPASRVILLTCHEDFYYAKRAIQLDVDDYLIKDELTLEQLKESVIKSINYLKESTDFQEALKYQETIHHNKDILKQSFLKNLTDIEFNEKILDFSWSLGINWKHNDFIVCSSFIDYSSCSHRLVDNDSPEIHGELFCIADDLAKGNHDFTILQDKHLNLVIIYNFKKSISTKSFEVVEQFLTSIQLKVKDILQLDVRFFHNNICDKSSLGSSINKLNKLKSNLFYTSNDHSFQEVHSKKTAFNLVEDSLLDPFMKGLNDSIQYANHDEVGMSLNYLEETARTLQLEPFQLKEKCLQILNHIFNSSNSSFSNFEMCFKNSISIEDMIHLLNLKIHASLEDMENTKYKHTIRNPKIKEIDQYIIEHLSENITSIIMANHLHLNPSYFSRYFKQLTGENFTDYVHRFKIRLAITMLTERYESIENIAYGLGYSDRTYFSKIFKKYTGLSPGEYKRTTEKQKQL